MHFARRLMKSLEEELWEGVYLHIMSIKKFRKLVEDGKIVLDGTETETEKEQLIFLKTEIIQDYEAWMELDLVFVLEALKEDTIYTKKNKGVYVRHHLSLKKHKGEWCIFIKTNHYVRTRDYGVTWALTKEELETK